MTLGILRSSSSDPIAIATLIAAAINHLDPPDTS